MPVIYGGLGAFVSTLIYNQNYYNKFIAVLRIVNTGSVPGPGSRYYSLYVKYKTAYDQFSGFSKDRLTDLSGSFQRDRDLSALAIIGVWGINVLDAYISAKLIKSYTMDNNLAVKIAPDLIYGNAYAGNNQVIPSLKIVLSIN